MTLAEPDAEVFDLELSPDGSRLAWTQSDGVFIRRLDEFGVIAVGLKGTAAAGEMPTSLAWSPDATQLAFTTQGALWRVSAEGEHVTLVTYGEIQLDTYAQLDWTRDGQLVYSDGKSRDLLGRSFLVEQTTPLFSADESTTIHFDGVHVLPDDSLLVVRHRKGIGEPDTLALWRDGELRDVLQLTGWNVAGPAYARGQLVFERRDSNPNSIWTVPFDLEAGRPLATRIFDPAAYVTATVPSVAGGQPEEFCEGILYCISPDGTLAITGRSMSDTSSQVIEVLDLAGGGVLTTLGAGLGEARPMGISPDNRWVLCLKQVAGQAEVFAQSLGEESQSLQVTTAGARFASYSASGEVLYSCSGSSAHDLEGLEVLEGWSVDWHAEPGPEPTLGAPRKLFEIEGRIVVTDFDPRQARFLGFQQQAAEGRRILLKTGWTDAQRAR